MVRQRSAKPLFAGSIPAVASKLSTPKNFRFQPTVESHGWYLLAPNRWARGELVLRRAEALTTGVVDLEITHKRGALHVSGAEMTPELETRLARMFQLEVDTSEFVELSRSSPDHAWVAASGFGRLLCGTTLWEDVVKIIATTNTTWRQTMRMVELLVETCGRRSPQGFAAFPDPTDVAKLDVDTLQQECRLGYRAKSIHTLAIGIVDRSIDLHAIASDTFTTPELYKSYQVLPGIGPYGAAHLLAMDGRHDFIAVDSEFRRFVRERHYAGRKVADATMVRRYKRWGKWKYLAYWSELWASVAESLRR